MNMCIRVTKRGPNNGTLRLCRKPTRLPGRKRDITNAINLLLIQMYESRKDWSSALNVAESLYSERTFFCPEGGIALIRLKAAKGDRQAAEAQFKQVDELLPDFKASGEKALATKAVSDPVKNQN